MGNNLPTFISSSLSIALPTTWGAVFLRDFSATRRMKMLNDEERVSKLCTPTEADGEVDVSFC